MSLAAQETADPFAPYLTLLALSKKHKVKNRYHAAVEASGVKIDANVPLFGFYRVPDAETGKLEPIYISPTDDGEFAIEYGADRHEVRLDHRIWPKAVWRPVDYDWWVAVVAPANGTWPDDDEGPQEATPDDWRAIGDAPPIGDNAPPAPVVDPESLEGLKQALKKLAPRADRYLKINDELTRDKSQVVKSEAASIASKIDNLRLALTTPLVEAKKKIDSEYTPPRDEAAGIAAAITRAQRDYGTEQLRKQREAEAAVAAALAEEARKVEQARIAGLPPPPKAVSMPVAPAPVVTEFRGATGRVGKQKPTFIIPDDNGVTDWLALATYYIENADLRAALLKLARKDLKDAGVVAPGVRTEEVMR